MNSEESVSSVAGMKWKDRAGNWLEERFPWREVRDFLYHKKVPMGRHSPSYYLGGMAFFCFVIQIVTGTLLLVYYKPSAEQAYESVKFITVDVPFGWLIRSIHSWCANLMVGLVMAHMFSVYLLKSYRKPRELTWLTGMGLLVISFTFGFSGYLLPWNMLAFFATKVGTETLRVAPVVGETVMVLMRGGPDVTEATLNRFFALHVMVLPLACAVLLGIHILLVQIHGMSLPIKYEKRPQQHPGIPFYPDFMLRDAVGWLLILGILATLAVYYPWPLGKKAELFAPTPEGIRPEWYFLFVFETLKLAPAKILGVIEGEFLVIMGVGAGVLLWAFIPFLDRKAQRGESSRLFTAIGVAVLLYIIVMTVYSLTMGGGH